MSIYLDTEYNSIQPILLNAIKVTGETTEERFSFDLRANKDTELLRKWVNDNAGEVFIAYALAAEIDTLCRVGIDPSAMKCIDLMAECRMISMTHPDYFCPEGSLVSHLKAMLDLETEETKEIKERMRDLIIRQNSWTDAEWADIVHYCWTDIEPLRALLTKVIDIHAEMDYPLTVDAMLCRGEYVRMCAEMDHASKGFPVYGDSVEKIFGNKNRVKKAIIDNLPPIWRTCFAAKKGGGYTLKRDRVLAAIGANDWWHWQLTDNDQPSLDNEYLEKLEIVTPIVAPLRQALKSLNTLNSADMRDLKNAEGYIKPKTFGFSAKTGRNGLKPKGGYLLNLPAWLRKIIVPHPGWCLVGADWSQQEVAVAAMLSGDLAMKAAYETGDVYLALGKMAGAIPPDGNKKTHGTERKLFKAIQLSLTYGKGIEALTDEFVAILADQDVDRHEAKSKAREILKWHKETFSVYWDWIEEKISDAKYAGWIETLDHWVAVVDHKTPRTQLLNWPIQSNGAYMMREVTKLFYHAWKLGLIEPVLCSQHDAMYFNIREENLDSSLDVIKLLMDEAGMKTIGMVVVCDTKVFTNTHPYEPENLTESQRKLWEMTCDL